MIAKRGMSTEYVRTPSEALERAKFHRRLGDNVVIQFCSPIGKGSDGEWAVGCNQDWQHSDEELAKQLVADATRRDDG